MLKIKLQTPNHNLISYKVSVLIKNNCDMGFFYTRLPPSTLFVIYCIMHVNKSIFLSIWLLPLISCFRDTLIILFQYSLDKLMFCKTIYNINLSIKRLKHVKIICYIKIRLGSSPAYRIDQK